VVGDLVELRHDRRQPLNAEIELFDQPHDLVAADDQSAPGGPLLGGRGLLAHDDVVVSLVESQQVASGD
jgi:hypothetical protein